MNSSTQEILSNYYIQGTLLNTENSRQWKKGESKLNTRCAIVKTQRKDYGIKWKRH